MILEAEGCGHYVGCNLNIHNLRKGERFDWPENLHWPLSLEEAEGNQQLLFEKFNWYGEGDDMIFIDGEEWPPSLHGTGTEDYFNTAYCPAVKFDAPYHGMTLPGGPNWSGKISVYRFHIEDPVHFKKSIRVTIEHGHANHRSDDYSSTAYWYQPKPPLICFRSHSMSSPMQGVLASLPYQAGVTTRQISAENPTGEKGKACPWDPNPDDPNLVHSRPAMDLGRGWKVHPFIKVKAGETVALADIVGPGIINQFWITSDLPLYRALVLRFYWDDEQEPSVEVPMGDFFAMGHDASPHMVNSMPVVVGPYRACQSYWQMPFQKHARITLQNEGMQDAHVVAYKIIYKLHAVLEDAAYFHAQWRRSMTRREHPEHVILDGVKGKGLYVGTYLAWLAFSRGWWGEGEVKFFLDGDTDLPTIADNGTEDYFGGAWCFFKDGKSGPEQVFNTPYCGLPLACVDDPQGPRRFSLYRWHLLDSIGFSEDLRVTIQALGWWPDGKYEPLTDDIASVAYWYQCEPHAPFPKFPSVRERWGR